MNKSQRAGEGGGGGVREGGREGGGLGYLHQECSADKNAGQMHLNSN